jgi:hypothetical protein
METFIYSLGVIYSIVSCISGSMLAYYLLGTIFSKNNYNIIQTISIIISISYVCIIVGFIFTLLFPLFVLIILTYTSLGQKYILSLIPNVNLFDNIIIDKINYEELNETEQAIEQPTNESIINNEQKEE